MKLIAKSLLFVSLAPFVPLKAFRMYDEESKQGPFAFSAFFIGLTLLTLLLWFMINQQWIAQETFGSANSFFFFLINIFNIISFMMVFMIGLAATKGDIGGFYSLFILLAAILVPQLISFIAFFFMDIHQHVYLDWLSSFWQMGIVSMGIWVRHQDNLITASIIAVVGVLGIHALDQVLFLT